MEKLALEAKKKDFATRYAELKKLMKTSEDPFEIANVQRRLLFLSCNGLNKDEESFVFATEAPKYLETIKNGALYDEKIKKKLKENNSATWKSQIGKREEYTKILSEIKQTPKPTEEEMQQLKDFFRSRTEFVPRPKPKSPPVPQQKIKAAPKISSFIQTQISKNFAPTTCARRPAEASTSKFGKAEASTAKFGREVASTSKCINDIASTSKYNNEMACSSKCNNDIASSSKYNNEIASSSKYNNDIASSSKYNNEIASSSKYNNEIASTSKCNVKIASTSKYSNENRLYSLKAQNERRNSNEYLVKKSVKPQQQAEEENIAPSCFRTAKDELNIQNVKKYGANAPIVSAPKRRRLGMRRGDFISPMLSNKDRGSNNDIKSDTPKSSEEELVVDERLKNIDPKMVELIKSEIMDIGQNVDWNDIAGLEGAKNAIQEAVVWPMLRPDIFTGLRRPPKGILLFGPPGTGKTLIGKCVASQSNSTFFSISASSLTSKWVGDGEKMVRALFAVARCHQPAVIFIDEIDSLLSQRSDTEHESSRRIKTEFLVQLDGATTDNEDRLLLIGATNRPQELDEAARRRFVKRLYIPLPEYEARLQLIQRLMSKERHSLSDSDLEDVGRLSEGYSGADMRNLCADACMGPIRTMDIKQIQNIQAQEVRPVTMEDFTKSLQRIRSSVSPSDLNQYIAWDQTYGLLTL